MQLTRYTDYSLRVLIYLASGNDGASVSQISEFYGISYSHLTKVVAQLSTLGLIRSVRGRGGGLSLAVDPAEIKIGDVVRSTENLDLLECFNRKTNTCPLASNCALENLLHQATGAFFEVLDAKTLEDLVPLSHALVQVRTRKVGPPGK